MSVAGAGKEIITSHLLVAQSKRLLLRNVENKLARGRGSASLMNADEIQKLGLLVDQLAADAHRAQGNYRRAVLKWGSGDTSDFWVVAYSSLASAAAGLVTKLKESARDLPATDRYEASTDVEALELLIDRWTAAMRASMSAAVA